MSQVRPTYIMLLQDQRVHLPALIDTFVQESYLLRRYSKVHLSQQGVKRRFIKVAITRGKIKSTASFSPSLFDTHTTHVQTTLNHFMNLLLTAPHWITTVSLQTK